MTSSRSRRTTISATLPNPERLCLASDAHGGRNSGKRKTDDLSRDDAS